MIQNLSVNPFKNEPYLKKQIKPFINKGIDLINDITGKQRKILKIILFEDLLNGLGSAEITQHLISDIKLDKEKSLLIARWQVMRFGSDLSGLRMINSGIQEYKWLTAGDNKVSEDCKRNNGKIFRNDTPPPITGHPSYKMGCRCTRQAVITDDLFK